ncbi:UNVERIFIED_CONTAM: hypothetical protein HDU68_007942 [Siphonaria sp. JEL0065]|nr:hypothetical protein HDU68_007942 [Siphonaria sp. JEL0065]
MVTSVTYFANVTDYLPLTPANMGFAFLQGGQSQLSVSNLQLTNNHAEAPRVFATVCDQSIFSFYGSNVATNSTLMNLLFCGSTISAVVQRGCPAVVQIQTLNLSPSTDSFYWNYSIPTQNVYDSFLIFCGDGETVKLSYSYESVNPGPNFVKYLGFYEMEALYIEIVFLSLWGLVLIVWGFLWLRNWNMTTYLHSLVSFIPMVQFLWIGYITARYVAVGLAGPSSVNYSKLFLIQSVIMFVRDFVLLSSFMAMAKGWGVIRVRLSGVEKRTVFGLAFFYAMSDFLYAYNSEFMFAFWVFAISSFYYLVWTIHVHIRNTERHASMLHAKLDSLLASGNTFGLSLGTPRVRPHQPITQDDLNNNDALNNTEPSVIAEDLPDNTSTRGRAPRRFMNRTSQGLGYFIRGYFWHSLFPQRPKFAKDPFGNRVVGMGEDWKLLWTLESKVWMLKSSRNIIVFYGFFTFLDKFIQFMGINVIPFYPTLPNLYNLGGFLWIASVFVLRQPEHLVVVPGWIMDKRHEMGKPISIDEDADDGRRGRVLAELRRTRQHHRASQNTPAKGFISTVAQVDVFYNTFPATQADKKNHIDVVKSFVKLHSYKIIVKKSKAPYYPMSVDIFKTLDAITTSAAIN